MGRMTRVLHWTVAVATASAVAQATPQPDTSTRSVIKAAAAYVAEYERQLTSILADEIYTQKILQQVPRDEEMPWTRNLHSEIFFMFAPASGDWMAIRDVVSVDGEPLRDRPDVREALATLPAREVAAKFKEFNSRFNIGRTFRNFNEPTLSLLPLDEHHRHRFSFDRKSVRRDGDVVLVTLAFTEKEPPTLIFEMKQGRVFSKGELVVEAASGRVRRALLSAKIGELSIELTTVFAPDARLGMWVPAMLVERYHSGTQLQRDFNTGSSRRPSAPRVSRRAWYERIVCEARYTNYRRFETEVRIR